MRAASAIRAPIRNVGSPISAARSPARSPLSKNRRPIRARPISLRSGSLARSVISTGASRWNGGKIIRGSPPGSRPSPRTSRPSSAQGRRPYKGSRIMTPHTADTPADPPYWLASPSKPKLRLPPGSSDSHVHIFGPRKTFPFAEGRNYTPSDATKEMLFALHELLGIEHCVIVQPNCHGYDNLVTDDAIAAIGLSGRGNRILSHGI